MFTKRISREILSRCILNRKSILQKKTTIVIQQKHFTACNNLFARVTVDLENNYAYNVMEKRGYVLKSNNSTAEAAISKELFESMLNKDWSRRTPDEIFSAFPEFGKYCVEQKLCISNKMFDTYIDNLTDNLKFASDEELDGIFVALNNIPQTESVKSRNFIEVWAALDDECLSRYKDWAYDKMLQFVSRFYMLGITKVSDYCLKCVQKLTSKARHLSPEQVVQTIFFIGVLRKSPLEMHNLEVYVEENFMEFNIDELAIISMGWFKSKTPIRSMQLVKNLMQRVTEQSKVIQDISLVALLKIIRYSMKVPDDDSIYKLLDILEPELPRLNVMSNVHTALLGTSTMTLHKGCLNTIAENIIDSIENARIKDLERLVLTFGTFNFKPNTKVCFFEKVLEELRKPEREPEINKFGRSLACCVSYFGLLGIYPEDLIAKVLQEEFLNQTYGKYCLNYGREILTLHNVSEIFNLDGSIRRLKKNQAVLLSRKYTDYMPSEDFVKSYNVTETMCLDIMKLLKQHRGGSEYVIGDHIVTHHQRGDIIICNDSEGRPVSVEPIEKLKFGLIKKLPDTENNWIALVVAGKNVIIRKYDQPTGQFYTKLRELRQLGYKSSVIIWSIYSKLSSDEEKINYINSVIDEALNKQN